MCPRYKPLLSGPLRADGLRDRPRLKRAARCAVRRVTVGRLGYRVQPEFGEMGRYTGRQLRIREIRFPAGVEIGPGEPRPDRSGVVRGVPFGARPAVPAG